MNFYTIAPGSRICTGRRARVSQALTLPCLVMGVVLTGCARTPVTDALVPKTIPVTFTDSGSALSDARWWTVFDEPTLSECVDRALADNFDLLAAWERLRAARAVAARVGADRTPELTGAAGARVEEGDGGANVYRAELAARYEVDLWGAIGSRAEAEALRAQASLSDYQAAALTLAAEVGRAWVAVVDAKAQLALTEQQIETNTKVLSLLRARFVAGLIRSADVLRQKQLIESSREKRIVADARLSLAQHQLNILQGIAPAEAVDIDGDLPVLPVLPDMGLPSELVQRRPDVQSALLALQAADHDLAAAVSARYPRINLTASLDTAAERPADLFNDWLLALAGEVIAPLLTGGRLSADVARKDAERAEGLALYQQTVLTALQEVEDALVNEHQQQRRVKSIQTQLSLANQTYRQLGVQYINGVSPYLDVLAALTAQQDLESDLLTARRELIENRIRLYRTLAGPIETPEPLETQQDTESDISNG